MPQNYRPGDVEIVDLRLESIRGTIDLLGSFVSASIYESVFTPGIVADIRVIDMNDALGELKISGDEMVYFTTYVRGSLYAPYVFALHELAGLENVGAQKGKMYVLRCVSEEAMHAKTNFVQKSYNELCSDMVQDIHRTYMKSVKPIVVEPTNIPQKIIVPHRNPFLAVDLIKRRSVSPENKSSFYVFFENRVDEQCTYNFQTLEKLFSVEAVKDFKMSDTINTSIRERVDDNILAYKIPQQFNAIERITLGGPRRVTFFNFTTWEFENRDVPTEDVPFKDGGKGTTISPEFKSKYFNPRIPPQALIPVDISQRPETFIPEATPDFQAYISLMMQNSVKIRVIGDTVLTAGSTINCTLPNRRAMTSGFEDDPLITGKFLVSRIHHKIGEASDKPRYTCVIEAVKGKFEEGV